MKTGSIRTLQARQDRLLVEYHEAVAEIAAEIEEIRTARGTKIKAPDWTGHHEVGRDADPDRDYFDYSGRN